MNKSLLLEQILLALESVLQNAVDAAEQAHSTATHTENVAENKYDTLGLEAAYLAHGQTERIGECEADIAAFKKLNVVDGNDDCAIALGAVITLINNNGIEQTLFMGPAAGGLKLNYGDKNIVIITAAAPLGKALLGRYAGDEIALKIGGGEQTLYTITSVA